MIRLLSSGIEFNPMPRALRDKDWWGRGLDKDDMKALRKKDDEDYERGWDGKTPSRPKRKHERTKMAELVQEIRATGGVR